MWSKVIIGETYEEKLENSINSDDVMIYFEKVHFIVFSMIIVFREITSSLQSSTSLVEKTVAIQAILIFKL